jgi:hypothetical protein
MMNGLCIADNRRRFVFARTRMREKNRTYTPSGLNCKLRAHTYTHTYTHRIVLPRRSLFLSRAYVRVCITIEREHH